MFYLLINVNIIYEEACLLHMRYYLAWPTCEVM
jgi:hypothetical protein